MISICIPVYNFDVRQLVHDLLEQMDESMELILIDDASNEQIKQINTELKSEKLMFIELEKNVGRSKIRNLFLKYAKNKFLLFLDCDSQIVNKNYLQNYQNSLNDDSLMLFGGSTYSNECPSDNQRLRWVYGTTKESKSAEERSLNPNKSFMTNNFIVKRELLQSNPFDERITQYGHEDTILGIEMAKKGVTIEHIQNPVMNIDIDSNEVFMFKTEQALDGLKQINDFYEDKVALENSITLLKVANKLQRYKLKWAFKLLYKLIGKSLRKNLISSKNPSMRKFGLYKLMYYQERNGKLKH